MWTIIIATIIVAIYKGLDSWLLDNSLAHDVDHRQMNIDSTRISRSELKSRYKRGYYNRKK